MAGATQDPMKVNDKQERSLLTYATAAQQLLSNQFSIRDALASIDRAYMREEDFNDDTVRARLANRSGDAAKMQDPTVPIVMPQVESALGYFMETFLTGYPVFGVAADPTFADSALQMETIIAENSITAKWKRELIKFFRDGFKYNIHALEVTWQSRNTASVETSLASATGAAAKQTVWQGNVLKRMDLYNTFWDPRVDPCDISEHGEFAGYIELMSRVRLKKYINELHGVVNPATVTRAFESSMGAGGFVSSSAPFMYYQPMLNPEPLQQQKPLQVFDWMSWATDSARSTQGIRYGNMYQVTTLYARIIPADFDFKVSSVNTPQVWKFVIINNQVVLFAEKQTNAHNKLPILFGQPIDDGLNYQTKSFAGNVRDMQNVSTAMLKGFMASKRRLVGDRVIYDPTRILAKDINSSEPAAKIPVRPSAFGKPLNEAVFPFPYRDEQTTSLLEGAMQMVGFADKINNQNQVQQGQFVKGNKTRSEFNDVMAHGNMRNKMMAITTEESVLTDVKHVLKFNILQYQGEAVLYNSDKNATVKINPVDLRKAAVHFKLSDGVMPSDKLLGTEELQTAIQVFGSSPQVAAGYNLAPMISYMFKGRGLDLRPFEKSQLQMQFEQQQASWQQIALEAIKAGQQPPPQPQMPPELVQELQKKQQVGGASPSPTAMAAESTVGGNSSSSPGATTRDVGMPPNPQATGRP
jgi:hypothetical protein